MGRMEKIQNLLNTGRETQKTKRDLPAMVRLVPYLISQSLVSSTAHVTVRRRKAR